MYKVWLLLLVLQDSSFAIQGPDSTAKWSKEGKTLMNGTLGNNTDQVFHPYGLFMDSNNNLYIADSGNNRILKLATDASHGTIVAGFGPNQLTVPTGIAMDKQSNLYILEGPLSSSGRVIRWEKDANVGTVLFYGAEHLSGIVLDEKEEFFYHAESIQDRIIRYTKDGQHNSIVAGNHGQGSALYQLVTPWHVAIDRNHTLYIADSGNNRVLKWVLNTPEGILVAGGNGYGNDTNQLKSPRSLLIDDEMNILYIADTYNDRIVRVAMDDGTVTIIAGGNGQGNAAHQLSHPNGLAFDNQGNLYVSDYENHRIQLFTLEKNSCNYNTSSLLVMYFLIFINILRTIRQNK
ncbi:hypothetical protein I4U23_015209 [Adineta vaga]|nr:hypothetical protein I4U23_015209 [Adineta vaga]